MTRTPPPAQAANDYRTLANVLADGRWGRALELADAAASPLRASGGGGGSSIGTHSDPTATAALNRPDPVPAAAELVSAYDGLQAALGVRGGSSATWTAGRLEGHAKLLVNEHRRPDTWTEVWLWVDRCLRLHAQVITPAAAAAHEAEKDRARTIRRCGVCEAPMPDHDRRDVCSADRWLWDDAQRNVKGRARWTTHADTHHTDWARFTEWVRARIADPAHVDNRIPLQRPGSPFQPAPADR